MRTKIKGTIETEIYTAEGGYVVIRQAAPVDARENLCLLTADQLPQLIRELEALYADRQAWEEAAAE